MFGTNSAFQERSPKRLDRPTGSFGGEPGNLSVSRTRHCRHPSPSSLCPFLVVLVSWAVPADEASVRTDYHAGTTWAPVGQTPVVTGSAVRQAVKMVSAIGQRGELSFQVHEGSMNAERFVEFLESLLHDFDTPVFLVVDGSSVHKARIVTDYVASTKGRLELFFLPPYSPELNPDEWVNKNVKHDRIARAVPLTRDELKAVALDALERLKRCPGIVRGFFGDPKLAYIRA